MAACSKIGRAVLLSILVLSAFGCFRPVRRFNAERFDALNDALALAERFVNEFKREHANDRTSAENGRYPHRPSRSWP